MLDPTAWTWETAKLWNLAKDPENVYVGAADRNSGVYYVGWRENWRFDPMPQAFFRHSERLPAALPVGTATVAPLYPRRPATP